MLNKRDFIFYALVVWIVFLILGGSLKGQHWSNENARVASTVSTINGLRAAVTTFRDTYGALPGDLIDVDMLPKCKKIKCIPGNGDGRVGPSEEKLIRHAEDERRLFWQHLYMADLYGSDNADYNQLAWGENFPSTKFGGGFHIGHRKGKDEIPPYFLNLPRPYYIWGLYIIMSDQLDGNFTLYDKPAYRPLRIAQIDRKIDDGKPFSGTVQAAGPDKCFIKHNPGIYVYNEELEEKCINYAFILIQR